MFSLGRGTSPQYSSIADMVMMDTCSQQSNDCQAHLWWRGRSEVKTGVKAVRQRQDSNVQGQAQHVYNSLSKDLSLNEGSKPELRGYLSRCCRWRLLTVLFTLLSQQPGPVILLCHSQKGKGLQWSTTVKDSHRLIRDIRDGWCAQDPAMLFITRPVYLCSLINEGWNIKGNFLVVGT